MEICENQKISWQNFRENFETHHSVVEYYIPRDVVEYHLLISFDYSVNRQPNSKLLLYK